jgi:hypothetical protein
VANEQTEDGLSQSNICNPTKILAALEAHNNAQILFHQLSL